MTQSAGLQLNQLSVQNAVSSAGAAMLVKCEEVTVLLPPPPEGAASVARYRAELAPWTAAAALAARACRPALSKAPLIVPRPLDVYLVEFQGSLNL